MVESKSHVYNPGSQKWEIISADILSNSSSNSLDFVIESHLPDSEPALKLTKKLAENNMDEVTKFCASLIYSNLMLLSNGIDAKLSVSALYTEDVYGFMICIGECHVYRIGRPFSFEIPDYGGYLGTPNIDIKPGCLLVQPGDRFLITTSAIKETDDEIEDIIQKSTTPEEASSNLLKHFGENQKTDNLAWIVRFF